jgi:hypothetical protein
MKTVAEIITEAQDKLETSIHDALTQFTDATGLVVSGVGVSADACLDENAKLIIVRYRVGADFRLGNR